MSTPAAVKEQALQQVVRLMDDNHLVPAEVSKAYQRHQKEKSDAAKGATPAQKHQMVLRLFYYLGSTLVFVGLGVYIEMVWKSLDSLSRVLVTLGTGFVAYLLGIFFTKDKFLEKAATPAFIIAFILQTMGLFVYLKEYSQGGNPALGCMFVFGLVGLQQGLTFGALRRPALLLFTLLAVYGFIGAATVYFHLDRGVMALASGLFLFFMAVDMHAKKSYSDLTPFFFILSTAVFFSGLYFHVGRTMFDPLALTCILGLLAFSVFRESRTLYILSLLFLAGYFCGGPGGGGWGSHWDYQRQLAAIFAGTSLILTAQWIDRSPFISAAPVWMFVGTAYALAGAEGLLLDTAFEPLFVGVAAGGIYASLALRSRAMLAASVLGLIGFIVYYSSKYFAHVVGWPLLLIFIGFVVLLSGFLFARLAGRIKSAA